ncbi:hypothetical protein QUA35_21080 [Microcoleus sp. N9_B2]|uniref:hypothetical protein n=1 Tax=unclassified Microcoleus TaxID=2642155 RepID=UPI002FD51B09
MGLNLFYKDRFYTFYVTGAIACTDTARPLTKCRPCRSRNLSARAIAIYPFSVNIEHKLRSQLTTGLNY